MATPNTSARLLSRKKPKRDLGPLRRIVQVIRTASSLYGNDWVLLECGHEGRSSGGVRARCRKCRKQDK
jgi:hypothetical protein